MSQLGDALTDASLLPPQGEERSRNAVPASTVPVPISAFVCWASNPAQIAPEQKVLAGLRRDDLFTVVLEQFMTDAASYADGVLPSTTQLEHLDVMASWGHQYVTWNEPAVAPVGEATANTEVFRLLAARLGFGNDCFSQTDEQLAAALLDGSPGGVSLEELRSRGFVKIDAGQGAGPTPTAGSRPATGSCPSRPTGWPAPASIRCRATTLPPRPPAPVAAGGFRWR